MCQNTGLHQELDFLETEVSQTKVPSKEFLFSGAQVQVVKRCGRRGDVEG